MQITSTSILSRYTYDPDAIPTHGTPLLRLPKRPHQPPNPVPPNTTVRIGDKYLSPKQLVHALHQLQFDLSYDGAVPALITLPRYILNIDGDPNNIRIENLHAAAASRRWHFITTDGVLIPNKVMRVIPPEDKARLDLLPNPHNDYSQSDTKQHQNT